MPTVAVDHLQRALELDPFDVTVHERLIKVLHDVGRLGEARRAHERYTSQMRDLGERPRR